jgi:membrane protease subunit (stomatin/prohibitin family)
MSLFRNSKQKPLNEFIDRIEWINDTTNTMIWCYPRFKAEIKNGAQLIVRDTQVAILVNEGQFADVYQPGCYELTTNNMPILTALKGWKYVFNSLHKVDVYFINTKQFLNLHWGMPNPIMMYDNAAKQLHNFVISKFTNYLAESKIAALDLAANLNEFSSELTFALKNYFSEYGIELISFLVENISLPEDVEEALFDKLNTNMKH